ncbi:cell division protein FtsK [Actinomyces oris]|uniref:Cell division protein FtsK n=1 Tax=Actinomyces oris TaxID=544580 RepID=A0A508BCV9_9ACTO|nr:FtsK/SpoIIIE domain-containing protein [Actinomyces oris]QQC40506.1 cell division protein FtsK [Actinomyces oris]TQD60356.1 cell division protein FtsK [Actinomyces oris]
MDTPVADQLRLRGGHLDFIGRSHIWIDDYDRADSVQFAQFAIANALAHTAPGQLEVLVFDDALRGIAAPFQEVNSGGEKILRHINDLQELNETIKYLHEHVRSVLNVIQGRTESLLDFRQQLSPKVEGFKLVVLSTIYHLLSDEIRDKLTVLLKAGPAAGVTFLIHSMKLKVNDEILDLTQLCDVDERMVYGDDGAVRGQFDPQSADDLISVSRHVASALANAQVEPVAFSDVQPLDAPWSQSSRDGISFAVGTYGMSTIEVTLGDELNQRHNALITGAVGQGKSNLISVVVHSLCQRYSPSEVEFYMLDFKEGVTLQAFAPDPHTGSFLPHARVLGLDADREYGVNVLRHLFAIYRQRMATFKAAGVQNIRQYRLADPEAVMPRIVVVIDEFQMLFADQDTVATTASDLIIKGARLFRACGIHFILASQTIGSGGMLGGTTGQALFAQIPVRLALKNSLAESHATLGLKNDAASHIRSREAIVNLDYGELSSNRKTTIAYADDAILAELRTAWWQQAQGTVTPPEVFEGERRLRLGDDARVLTNLQSRHAMLGRRITVGVAPLAADFSTDVGRNLALFGTGPGHTILLNAALSLLHSTPAAEIIGLDLTSNWHSPEHDNVRIHFERQLTRLGSTYRVVNKHQADALIDELVERAAFAADNASAPPVYVIGFGMERWRSDTTKIKTLFANGPLASIHLLGWWNKYSSFKAMVGLGGDNNFDIRMAMHLDHSSAREAFKQPILRWTPQDNRALVWDSATMSNPQLVIPYSRIS